MRNTIKTVVLVSASLIVLSGCTNMTPRQQATVSGAAIGAVGGGLIGSATGNPMTGVVVGAGVGAAAGNFINRHTGAED